MHYKNGLGKGSHRERLLRHFCKSVVEYGLYMDWLEDPLIISIIFVIKELSSMYEDILKHVDLFSGLEKKDLQALAASCKERKYSAGSTLLKQGDTGVGLYIITSGKVRITQAVHADKAEEELRIEGPGGVLGEMALLDDLPRSATVTAIEDVTALILPIWDFRATIQSHPDIALKLLAVLSRRLRKAENRPHDH
jgi:CRP/FNR family cyclic AMP-dependent transcriptional regulator